MKYYGYSEASIKEFQDGFYKGYEKVAKLPDLKHLIEERNALLESLSTDFNDWDPIQYNQALFFHQESKRLLQS